MKLNRSDREVFAIGSLAFAFVAMALAFAALVTAAHSESRSKAADRRVAKLAASAVVGSTAKVTLEEYWIAVRHGLVDGPAPAQAAALLRRGVHTAIEAISYCAGRYQSDLQ